MTNKKILCPHCKKKLEEGRIGFYQGGNMLYKVWFNKNDGDLQFDTDEFEEESGGGEFFCRNCGNRIPFTHDEIIEILK